MINDALFNEIADLIAAIDAGTDDVVEYADERALDIMIKGWKYEHVEQVFGALRDKGHKELASAVVEAWLLAEAAAAEQNALYAACDAYKGEGDARMEQAMLSARNAARYTGRDYEAAILARADVESWAG